MKALLTVSLLFVASLALGEEGLLTHAEREAISDLAAKPLPKQAEFIRKKVNIEVLKSNKKDVRHFFDFLGDGTKSIDDVSDLEGVYGKVQCADGQITPILYISDDAPPTTLLHEFIHFYEMEQTPRWCALEGRVLETEEKKEKATLYHKFEFETLKTLFEHQSKLTMNFEDKLIMFEGLSRENKVMILLGLNSLDEKMLQSVSRELEILHSQISYITWLSRTPDDAGSVLEKMEILTLRSCVESSHGDDVLKRTNDCVAARCALSHTACKKLSRVDLNPPTHDPLQLVIRAWTLKATKLLEDCPVTKLRDEFQDHLQEPTACWKQFYAKTHVKKEMVLVRVPEEALQGGFSAPELNVDEKIVFEKVTSPQAFIQKAYCYSVFQKTAGYGAIPVDQFAYATQGVTINMQKSGSYRAWLEEKEGVTCDKLVEMFTGSQASRLQTSNDGKKFMLIINPLGALSGGLDSLKKFLAIDINHERLHIIFSENKEIQTVVRNQWKRLSPLEKNKFKGNHPQYDFSEEDTVLREYFSFEHQDAPKLVSTLEFN